MKVTLDTAYQDLLLLEPALEEELKQKYTLLQNPGSFEWFASQTARPSLRVVAAHFLKIDAAVLLSYVREFMLFKLYQNYVQNPNSEVFAEVLHENLGALSVAEYFDFWELLRIKTREKERSYFFLEKDLDLFGGALADQAQRAWPEILKQPALNIFLRENRVIQLLCDELKKMFLRDPFNSQESLENLSEGFYEEIFRNRQADLLLLGDWLLRIEQHYKRVDQCLGPIAEKRGAKAFIDVLSQKNRQGLAHLNALVQALQDFNIRDFKVLLPRMLGSLETAILREEKILYPWCVQKFQDLDWEALKLEESSRAYALVLPRPFYAREDYTSFKD